MKTPDCISAYLGVSLEVIDIMNNMHQCITTAMQLTLLTHTLCQTVLGSLFHHSKPWQWVQML